MNLQALGYVGVKSRELEDWAAYASNFLGMQQVDASRGSLAFRMDDRKQRLLVEQSDGEGAAFFGWEVADAAALDALGAHLERHEVRFTRGDRALCAERHVTDLIRFNDPVGNRLEVFHGPATASDPFKPGRAISGFRTGPLGMGHAVLHTTRIDEIMPFYRDILGFKLSDYILRPFRAFFFHVNQRHHSLAFLETGKSGIHHLMVETSYLDDVGQAYDLALAKPEMIGTTLGRHANDAMTSFYSYSPAKFMFEYGWGGRTIDPANWTSHERTEGPSIWGHERNWMSPELREEARELRIRAAESGARMPVEVIDGNHKLGPGVCAWWDAAKVGS